jgi:hypothetical protein
MSTEIEVPALSVLVKKFTNLFQEGMKALEEASKLYVEAIDSHPNAKEVFMEKVPEIPASAWAGFEAVGRGSLDKRLLYSSSGVSSRLRKLPLSAQRRALDGRVDLLLEGGDTLKLKVTEATTEQLNQLIASNHIRTLGEQRLYLESKRTSAIPPIPVEARPPYVITGKGIRVIRQADFTKADLARILLELETS